MALFDEDEFRAVLETIDHRTTQADYGTTDDHRLGRLTMVCLIINRTIGSGIFISPAKVLRATGSMGAALLLWVFGGLFALSGLLVWLEFGLTIPRHPIHGIERSVPRSGGEKNYLEYVYTKPKYLVTCMFGIAFILLGNLSGNAYAFGIYVTTAAGYSETPKALTIGIALAALTIAVLIHMCTRRGGIYLNNGFALLKLALVLSIIVIGILKAAGVRLGGDPNALGNYNHAFESRPHGVASFADGFVYVAYAFTGFEQPFYVLSEFRKPKARFTRYTVSTVLLLTFLYIAVNVAYYFVVPVAAVFDNPSEDIATLFFERCFGNERAGRAMAAIIATSIFGNIIVMTFTAARVKQEIAKEGILWKSLFWATGRTTPAVKLWNWIQKDSATHNPARDPDQQEQTPMAGLLLHWIFSVVLIAVTAVTTPAIAYSILVSLYTYVVVVIIGFFVSLGLLLLKLFPRWRNWSQISHFQTGPLGLLAPLFYMLVNAFLIVMAFIPPTPKPSYSPYYLVPVIGVTAPAWGLLWWCGIKVYEKIRSKRLVVRRAPLFVQEKDKHGNPLDTYLQRVEVVERTWRKVDPKGSGPYGTKYTYDETYSYEP